MPKPAQHGYPGEPVDPDLAGKLRACFRRIPEHPSVIVAVYLFGSHGRHDARERSDVDLAFLLDEKAYRKDPFEASSHAYLISARIGMDLNKETDVTILNASSVEMAYEVVTTGLCLHESDHERRLEYEIKVRGLYFDLKPFLEALRTRRIKLL